MIYQVIQMLNNDFQKYLTQTKELFGDLLFINQEENNEFAQYGNKNSKIVFIKNSFSNNEEKVIFENMLKALKISMDQILIIDLINLNKLRNQRIINLLKEIQSDVVIILGLAIAKDILQANCDLDTLRINDYAINNQKIIPTYSLKEMATDKQFKKYVWSDLKVIL